MRICFSVTSYSFVFSDVPLVDGYEGILTGRRGERERNRSLDVVSELTPFQQHFPGAGHVEHAVCPMESYDGNVVWLLIVVSADRTRNLSLSCHPTHFGHL